MSHPRPSEPDAAPVQEGARDASPTGLTGPGGAPRSKRRAAVALILLLPVPTIGTAAATFWWPGSGLGQGLFVAAKIWILLLPALWHRLVDGQSFSLSPARRGGFPMAAMVGLLVAVAIVGVYALASRAGWIDAAQVAARARQTGLADVRVYVLGALYWVTLNSVMEEYVWRWFCFRQSEILLGGAGGVLVSALGFTLHHVVALAGQFSPSMTLLGSLGVLAGGLLWSWLYLRYRSIWPCYLSHAIVDIPIFLVGYRLIFG